MVTSKKVLVIGAAGNLGRRLILAGQRQGHLMTALVRDAEAFKSKMMGHELGNVRIVEGDLSDADPIDMALEGQNVAVNAAGNVNDGKPFSALFDRVASAIERHPVIEKAWFLAGAAVLDIPHTKRIGVGLPFVPAVYEPHRVNWQRLERSALDWSLMCPGPMTAAADSKRPYALRVSTDAMPYEVGAWTRFAPPIALSLVMKSKLPELIVSYEDVATVIVTNLDAGGTLSRHRVGVALPAGVRGAKQGWTLGQRGPDA